MPTKDRLLSRRVEVDIICPVCNLVVETTFHALVTCPITVLCCQHMAYTFDERTDMSLEQWIDKVLQHNRRNVVNKVFMVAWAIWNNMNDIVWKQKGKESIEIVASDIQVLKNWESAQDKSFDNSFGFITQTDDDVYRKQPTVGKVKVNTDATLFEYANLYNYAMVARDHEGKMLEAMSTCRQGCLNPELA